MSWISGPSISPCSLHVSAGAGGLEPFLHRLGDAMLARAEEETPAARQDDDFRWMAYLRLMHPAQAAAELRVAKPTVLAWARRGWIRYSQDGGRCRHAYSSEDVWALAELMRGRGIPSAHLIRALGWPDRERSA